MDRDKVLQIVKQRGPVLPVQISKEINTNVYFASAMLSELVSAKKIQFSHAKFGGSPFYYVPGQEEKLQQLYDQLPSKEKQAFDLLKKEQVVHDRGLDPGLRVAFRQMHDFAQPVEATVHGRTEIFWGWYLCSPDEIHQRLQQIAERIPGPPQPEQQPAAPAPKPAPEAPAAAPESSHEGLREELLQQLREEMKKELKKAAPPSDREQLREMKRKEEDEKDAFLDRIRKYLQKKEIQVLEYQIIKRNSEADLVLSVPSSLGAAIYFCKARNKKTVTEADLQAALLAAQSRKLPSLLITTGELTKRAKEIAESELRGVTVKKLS
ncbi:MAG TPA: restriction endonuclease [Candidatus Nanoarchaeia archaeon]|nr:restriction endonuclease [Candidatus Nanoarchaeia archaeon]